MLAVVRSMRKRLVVHDHSRYYFRAYVSSFSIGSWFDLDHEFSLAIRSGYLFPGSNMSLPYDSPTGIHGSYIDGHGPDDVVSIIELCCFFHFSR
jgi:hypothetical protein